MRSTIPRRPRAPSSALSLFAVLAVWAAVAASARGAELFVDAPESCADPVTLADEVGDLIGKPLTAISEVDFRVQIVETPQRRWRLRLETLEQRVAGGRGAVTIRGTREIDGATCGELAEAASVAIAVSVRSIAEQAGPTPSAPPASARAMTPPPSSAASSSRSAEVTPVWRPAVALALATDTGALPSSTVGVGLEASASRGSLRLALLATWFGTEDAAATDHAGGTFQLAVGGARACFAPRRGRWTPLACAGFELGRLAGTGQGVARPETGEALWRAVRADVGFTAALNGNTALLLTGGVAVPLTRPAFVLDGRDLVYSPSRLAVRLAAGLELEF